MQEDEEEDVQESLGSTTSDKTDDRRQIQMMTKTTTGWNKEKTRDIMNQPRELIDKYVQYINGDGGRPKKEMKKYEPTLISLSRKEKAKNKPLVECKIGNEKVKTMFDTGADLNVISQELAEKLVKQNSAIKISDPIRG